MLSTNVSIEQKITLPEFEAAGVEVYVKRDDLIHPFISGNKWRKLKYNYEAYKIGQFKGIVTFGGAYSNHIVATAAFCAQAGIPCIGIIRGEAPLKPNHVLILAQLWGMDIHYLSRSVFNDENARQELCPENWMVVPEGGNNADGVKGCADLIAELQFDYQHIFCASGTGCTISGLVNGVMASKLNTICHSIPVLKQGAFINEVVARYHGNTALLKVHPEFHFGGYGKAGKEVFEFIERFATQTGILTDPVYTAKLFLGLSDLVQKGHFKPGERILAIHTGGLTGLLSEKMLTDVQNIIIKKKPSSL